MLKKFKKIFFYSKYTQKLPKNLNLLQSVQMTMGMGGFVTHFDHCAPVITFKECLKVGLKTKVHSILSKLLPKDYVNY